MLQPTVNTVLEGERNKIRLMIALWAFKRELDCDLTYVRMTDAELAEVRETWGILVQGLRESLAAAGTNAQAE